MRLADIATEERDGVMVARVSGELDLSNVGDVRDALAQATPSRARGLVIDLSELRHIDSAGVRMLFELRRRLMQHRQVLAAVVPADARIADVVELLAVGETIPVFDAVVPAVDAVAHAQT